MLQMNPLHIRDLIRVHLADLRRRLKPCSVLLVSPILVSDLLRWAGRHSFLFGHIAHCIVASVALVATDSFRFISVLPEVVAAA